MEGRAHFALSFGSLGLGWMILVQRATCRGCCCLSCASPSRSHCPGVDKPVSLSLMPCQRRHKRVRVGRRAQHIKHLELIDFLHVLFDFVFEAADAGAGGASMWGGGGKR